MKKNKICIILFSLLFLNACVSQNFNMSQGDNNKNQTAHEEKYAQNNHQIVMKKKTKIKQIKIVKKNQKIINLEKILLILKILRQICI